uniref:Uncharacterized protein n=1 Tax=Parascaris equorum TaxID=6256 RepID=A0A914S4I8_PAREQ
MELCLTGDKISAKEAKQCGIVSKLCKLGTRIPMGHYFWASGNWHADDTWTAATEPNILSYVVTSSNHTLLDRIYLLAQHLTCITVFPPEKVVEEAINLADRIAQNSVLVTSMVKQAVNSVYETTLQQGIAVERALFHATFATVLLSAILIELVTQISCDRSPPSKIATLSADKVNL